MDTKTVVVVVVDVVVDGDSVGDVVIVVVAVLVFTKVPVQVVVFVKVPVSVEVSVRVHSSGKVLVPDVVGEFGQVDTSDEFTVGQNLVLSLSKDFIRNEHFAIRSVSLYSENALRCE